MKFPEEYRCTDEKFGAFRSFPGDDGGAFIIPDHSDRLLVLAVNGYEPSALAVCPDPWEHVSVTVRNRRGLSLQRYPTWEQMSKVKALFWEPSEVVIQFHPAEKDYVSYHDFCLHLWRKANEEFPVPPSILVGPK